MQEAVRLDGLAVRAARGSGALDLAIGEVLVRLFEGNRLSELGGAGHSDYIRERLGIPAATGLGWATLARGLVRRPLLRRAVVNGLVSPRKALAVMRVANDDSEAAWTHAAMALPLYELERRVKAEGFDPRLETFDVESFVLRMNESQQDRLDTALEMAEKVMGPGTPRWMKFEAMSQEWLGEFGGQCRPQQLIKSIEPLLPERVIDIVNAVPAPDDPDYPTSAVELERLAQSLVRERNERDEELGKVLAPIAEGELYREFGFDWFEDYVRERLLISPRKARQRVWLERQLQKLPPLREALRSGRVKLTAALEIAKLATPLDVEERIEKATETTWQDLNREATEAEDRQNRANGKRRVWGPADALKTVEFAIWSARISRGGQPSAADLHNPCYHLSDGEALARIADHFVAVWKDNYDEVRASKGRKAVFARQRGLCAVPGCSHAAQHEHHIVFRSQGGSDELSNRVGLCESHHMRAVHRGYLTVRGRAGEKLEWHILATGERWTTTGDDSVRRSVRRDVRREAS